MRHYLLRRVPSIPPTTAPSQHARSVLRMRHQEKLGRVPTIGAFRTLSMKPREEIPPLPPGLTLDSIEIPPGINMETGPMELHPDAHVRQPVKSAHMIVDNVVSSRDSVCVTPSGTIEHGRYGNLGVLDGIPLEYLALLRPAAEGAAATSKLGHNGTLLVFGATQASGLAALQLWKGAAVCAVVGGEHSGVDQMLGMLKGFTKEPGFVVAEEFALLKKNFADLVDVTVHGEKMEPADPQTYLSQFKKNLLANAEEFPDTRPAAVWPEEIADNPNFRQYDRDSYRENMDPYFEQFPAGSPPLDPAKVDAYFDIEQYAVFRSKFLKQTSSMITGDDVQEFSPAQVAAAMIESPESGLRVSKPDDIPFEFSLFSNNVDIPSPPGGPVAGAIIAVTPALKVAAEALAKEKTLRGKAEALQYLTHAQRNAFAAASSVVALAQGKPVLVVGGSLPGFESIEPSDADVKEAIAAMELGDDEEYSRLNFFVQVFRSGDFPIYEDYAVHRNSQGSPYQIIVTK